MLVFAAIKEESGLRWDATGRKRCSDSIYSYFSLGRCRNRNSEKLKSRKMEQEQDENGSPKH